MCETIHTHIRGDSWSILFFSCDIVRLSSSNPVNRGPEKSFRDPQKSAILLPSLSQLCYSITLLGFALRLFRIKWQQKLRALCKGKSLGMRGFLRKSELSLCGKILNISSAQGPSGSAYSLLIQDSSQHCCLSLNLLF